VRTGAVSGYVELARLGQISPARYSIMALVASALDPGIPPFLSAAAARFITESSAKSRGAVLDAMQTFEQQSKNDESGEHTRCAHRARFLSTFGAS